MSTAAPAPDQPSMLYRICRAIGYGVCVYLFDFKSFGARRVPRRGGALLVSNHQSYLDPLLVGVHVKRTISFLAKSELFTNRYFGWLIRNLNAFPVRQGKGDKGAMEETIRRLREGHVLTLFPEGGRTEDGQIAPMQRGVALVVKRSGVPIVPAVIDGAYHAWPRHRKLFRRHPVRVIYGQPLRVEGLKNDEIVDLIDRTLREMFDDLRAGRIEKYR